MNHAAVHGKGRYLSVALATVGTLVRLLLRVNDVVLVQARVLREPFTAALRRANIRLLTYAC